MYGSKGRARGTAPTEIRVHLRSSAVQKKEINENSRTVK